MAGGIPCFHSARALELFWHKFGSHLGRILVSQRSSVSRLFFSFFMLPLSAFSPEEEPNTGINSEPRRPPPPKLSALEVSSAPKAPANVLRLKSVLASVVSVPMVVFVLLRRRLCVGSRLAYLGTNSARNINTVESDFSKKYQNSRSDFRTKYQNSNRHFNENYQNSNRFQ
jgi:hypothetical protein